MRYIFSKSKLKIDGKDTPKYSGLVLKKCTEKNTKCGYI